MLTTPALQGVNCNVCCCELSGFTPKLTHPSMKAMVSAYTQCMLTLTQCTYGINICTSSELNLTTANSRPCKGLAAISPTALQNISMPGAGALQGLGTSKLINSSAACHGASNNRGKHDNLHDAPGYALNIQNTSRLQQYQPRHCLAAALGS